LAADPKTYDHTVGGGNAADVTDPNLNGFYFACGDPRRFLSCFR